MNTPQDDKDASKTNEQESCTPTNSDKSLRPARQVELSLVPLGDVPTVELVKSLTIRELKGPHALFTPKLALATGTNAMVTRATGAFETSYLLLGQRLMEDPIVSPRAQRVAFIPVLDWSRSTVVLLPIKMNRFGEYILTDLRKVDSEPVKAFVQWSEQQRRHLVYKIALTSDESAFLNTIDWPTSTQIKEALSEVAYDDIEQLAADSEEIRILRDAKEVR